MKHKICTKCKAEKSISEFYKNPGTRDKLCSWCKECNVQKKYQKEYYQSLRGRYSKHTQNARRTNRKNILTIEQFDYITKQKCYLCGEYTKDKSFCGIDRVDNFKDYILGNCKPCCEMCNMMKKAYTKKEFVDKCFKIVQTLLSNTIILK